MKIFQRILLLYFACQVTSGCHQCVKVNLRGIEVDYACVKFNAFKYCTNTNETVGREIYCDVGTVCSELGTHPCVPSSSNYPSCEAPISPKTFRSENSVNTSLSFNKTENITSSNGSEVVTEKKNPNLKDDVSPTPENTSENITSSKETEVVTEKNLPTLKDDVSPIPENASENKTSSNKTEVVEEKSFPILKDAPENTSDNITSFNETEAVTEKSLPILKDASENTSENITSSNETEIVTEKSLPILKDDVSSTPESENITSPNETEVVTVNVSSTPENTSENITLSNETEVVTEKSLPNFKDEISSTPHNTQSVTSSNETEVVAEKGVPILEDEISQTSKNCSFIKKQFNKLLKHVKNTGLFNNIISSLLHARLEKVKNSTEMKGSDEKEDARNSSLASSNSAIETNTSILRAESVHSKTDDNDDLTLVSTIPPIQMVTRNTDIAVSGASNKTTKGPNNESTEKAFSTTEGMFPLTTMITLYGNDTTIIVGSSGNATESPFYIATRRMLNSSNAPISTTLEKPINLGKYFRAAVNDNPPVSDENPLQATIVSDEPFDVLSPSGSSFSCVTSGFFKDPEDRSCTKYFFCAYKSKPGKFDLYQMRCPEFHQFNVQEQTCVMKQQPSCPTIRKYCERYGRYPDPEDYSCRKYISCFEDFASLYGKIVECPQNMQYNVLQRSCTKERQQGCPLIIDNINQVPW